MGKIAESLPRKSLTGKRSPEDNLEIYERIAKHESAFA
jgi:hypothetical protein